MARAAHDGTRRVRSWHISWSQPNRHRPQTRTIVHASCLPFLLAGAPAMSRRLRR